MTSIIEQAETQYNNNTAAIVKFMAQEIYYSHILLETVKQWRAVDRELSWTLGPCASVVVECGCFDGCEWCGGAKWLTERCKQAKTEAGE